MGIIKDTDKVTAAPVTVRFTKGQHPSQAKLWHPRCIPEQGNRGGTIWFSVTEDHTQPTSLSAASIHFCSSITPKCLWQGLDLMSLLCTVNSRIPTHMHKHGLQENWEQLSMEHGLPSPKKCSYAALPRLRKGRGCGR